MEEWIPGGFSTGALAPAGVTAENAEGAEEDCLPLADVETAVSGLLPTIGKKDCGAISHCDCGRKKAARQGRFSEEA